MPMTLDDLDDEFSPPLAPDLELWYCEACGAENTQEHDFLKCSCCFTLHPSLESE